VDKRGDIGMKTLSTKTVILTVLIVALLGIAACSRKEESKGAPAGTSLLAEPLLEQLPSNTAGFVVDIGGAGYARFRNSPYAGSGDAKAALEALAARLTPSKGSEDTAEVSRKIYDACVQAGLIGSDGKYTLEKVISRVVAFGGVDAATPDKPEVGLFARGAAGVDLAERVKHLRTGLTQAGLTTNDESVAGATGFTVSVPSYDQKIYVAANKSMLGASPVKAALEAFFRGDRTTTLATLKALPEFSKAHNAIGTATDPIALAFASVTRLIPAMKQAAEKNGATDFKPEEFALEAIAGQTSFPKEYVHNVALALTPKTDSQREILGALQASALPRSAREIPGDTALALSFDARFLTKLESLAQSIAESADRETAEQVKHIQALTLGIRNNASGAPIPDIFVAIDSAQRAALQSSIEGSLGAALALTGQEAKWQTKDVAGSPTRFATTLIGAGAYISTPKDGNTLFLGTSEGIVKDLVSAQSTKTSPVLDTLSARTKAQVQSANVGVLFLNFRNIAAVLESVKNTLAMFTGGNSELNAVLDATKMRSWGLATGTLAYTPGVFAIQTTFEEAPKN
jgi:hypothetical protein